MAGISLNKVLIELRDSYDIQFSFDDKLLSRYKITATREFDTKEDAISFLINDLPLFFEKSGDIFVVFPAKAKKKSSKRNKITRVGGQVVEAETYEPLPFSYIIINDKQVQSDQNGNFSFLASADTSFNMHISHLGYYVYDTLFNHSFSRKFILSPSVKELEEVKIEGFDVEQSTLIGNAAGKMKVNHTIAPYLPGYGDNSIYNVLRLMPGVLASGEQSSDLLVWGSYESHSKLKFDGFTIFGLKNFNDNIGVVNPLLIKDIRVLKGGYEANYGDRVGGIIEITGKNGNRLKPVFTMNISNSTINSLVEIPIGKKSTVLGAYRQTYYELYNPYDLNVFSDVKMDMNSSWEWQNDSNHGYENVVDVLVVPEYKFRDGNFKYTFRGDNGDILSASLYGGGDR
ncbi:MAG: TonB-dependent receptor [Draconibacterium sp.]|nr:TonB-dependent receptor [Draconibacterium sp.]